MEIEVCEDDPAASALGGVESGTFHPLPLPSSKPLCVLPMVTAVAPRSILCLLRPPPRDSQSDGLIHSLLSPLVDSLICLINIYQAATILNTEDRVGTR